MRPIYVSLYEEGGKVLIGKRREPKIKSTKTVGTFNTPDPDGQYCLIGGTQERSETYMQAAERIFTEITGHALPRIRPSSYTFERRTQVLVCFEVINLNFLAEDINVDLKPRPEKSSAPVSDKVLRWELSKVVAVQQSVLDSYLVSAASVDGKPYNLFKETIELLKTLR